MSALHQGYVPIPPPPPPIPTDPGGRVRWLRELHGLSQRALADAAGIGFGQLQGIESGREGHGYVVAMRNIASVLTNESGEPVSLGWLMCLDEPQEPRSSHPRPVGRNRPRKPSKATNTAWTASRSRSTRPDQRKQVLVAA